MPLSGNSQIHPASLARRITRIAILIGPLGVAVASAQPQAPPSPGAAQDRGAAGDIRPYERVITAEAKSDEGVFTVHRIDEKLYYEIPPSQLNVEFLWVGPGTGSCITDQTCVAAVPEPGTLILATMGILGGALARRRKGKQT